MLILSVIMLIIVVFIASVTVVHQIRLVVETTPNHAVALLSMVSLLMRSCSKTIII